MNDITFIYEDEVANYDKKKVLKIYEAFNVIDDKKPNYTMTILRSIYVKMGRKYLVYDEPYNISALSFNNIYKKLLNVYQKLNINDSKINDYLTSLSIQNVFYKGYQSNREKLSLEDISNLFDNEDNEMYNDLDDYYDIVSRIYDIKKFIPAWNSLGYVYSNDKKRIRKR